MSNIEDCATPEVIKRSELDALYRKLGEQADTILGFKRENHHKYLELQNRIDKWSGRAFLFRDKYHETEAQLQILESACEEKDAEFERALELLEERTKEARELFLKNENLTEEIHRLRRINTLLNEIHSLKFSLESSRGRNRILADKNKELEVKLKELGHA